MSKRKDISGHKYNRWKVINFLYYNGNDSYYECLCDCGTKSIISRKSLIKEKSKSCGCYQKEIPNNKRTHGEANKTDEYRIWRAMKYRCHVSSCRNYMSYGGRGIYVCDEWLNSYEQFLFDMGRRPTKKHTIERLNNNKGYSKDNCIWATYKQQANNKRSSSIVNINGEALTISQARDKFSITKSKLDDLLYRKKMSKEAAIISLI